MSFSSKVKSGILCLTPLLANDTAAGVISLPTVEDRTIYIMHDPQTPKCKKYLTVSRAWGNMLKSAALIPAYSCSVNYMVGHENLL